MFKFMNFCGVAEDIHLNNFIYNLYYSTTTLTNIFFFYLYNIFLISKFVTASIHDTTLKIVHNLLDLGRFLLSFAQHFLMILEFSLKTLDLLSCLLVVLAFSVGVCVFGVSVKED